MLTIRKASPHEPGPAMLLAQSHALLMALYPPEQNHFLSLDELAAPGILFFAAEVAGETLGTGALALKPGYGEVKSMFTAPSARGRGVAALVLSRLEEEARAASLPWLRLETGPGLDAAHRLYERHGFCLCGPFGDYAEGPGSVFYEKRLT